ncbi:MAG: restriction endonuclease subunit S [Streptococcus mitis]|jgi:hypothetical protein|nr:restriction endonuclease subunit S [Streptococcus mitis]
MKNESPKYRFDKFNENWIIVKLSDIACHYKTGGTPSTKDPTFWGGAIPWIQSSDIQKDRLFGVIPQKFISEEGLQNSTAKLIPKNSIAIVTRVGVGKLAIIDQDYTTSQDFLSISDFNGDTQFIAYSIYRMLQKESTQLQGTSIKGITKEDLLLKKISLPEIEEQSAIGSLFRTLDDLLSNYKENLANYQSLKATMLSKMFPKAGQTVPEIRLDGFEGEWENKRADEIFKSVSEKNRALLPVLSASQIDGMVLRDEIGIDIKYDEATLNNYKLVKPGQFVIHLRSFQGGFALSKLEGITSPAYTIIDFIDKVNNLPDFWNSILTSRDFIKRLETVTYGIRDGKSISFKDFSSLKFVFPEFKEQQAIGSYFSNLDNLINSHQEKISQLETLKKKLLQDMFI